MGELNVPRAEADALKVIDTQLLTALIERCVREERWACLRDLRLDECGPYVSSRLRAFEQAFSTHAAAKTAKKRELTGHDVREAGADLEHAVQQMKDRIATEERERQLFFVDDQVMPPSSLTENLCVRINYRWRESVDTDWQYGSTTFTYTYVAKPSNMPSARARKPSAARQAQEHQDELYRQWDYLESLGLHAIREHFRQGGGGATIPQMVRAKADPHTHCLNNFSARF